MTTLTRNHGPMLHPRITVLVRRNGAVQLGWDPSTAVILQPPGPAEAMPAFLRLLDGMRTQPEILWQARALGFDGEATQSLLDEMASAGLLAHDEPRSRLRTVRVHGRGPLSDALAEGLRRIGLRPSRSSERDTAEPRDGIPEFARPDRPELVVLADALVPDPALVAEFMEYGVPHLQVRMRDGRGVVGPLVLPGETSCLRCADLHRCDRDPDWPHLSAQLLGRVGYASTAGIAAATALALQEVETIAHGSAEHPPATLNTTLELDLDSPHIDHRPWPVHPNCGCLQGENSENEWV
ncbi:TOMM precursor leader peptide-binding protein [Nocardia sp. NPDC051030]|uniref:TOMM precursor leader peptide-binding protein n=1 Tax=Nocardia sp. NPDC051030 TaxID=3155162 RepID=UPI0034435AEF